MPKVVIAGASGLLGRASVDHFLRLGWQVVALERRVHSDGARSDLHDPATFKSVHWDPTIEIDNQWVRELADSEAVVNFSGASIAQRWTEKAISEILSSRVLSAKAIGSGIQSLGTSAPKVWINMSGIGIYGDRGTESLSEESNPGSGFLATVCKAWEKAVVDSPVENTKKVILRSSMVLSDSGGAFPQLVNLSKIVPTAFGNGKNVIPFIHVSDFVRIVVDSANGSFEGPINVCTPNPVSGQEFAKKLGKKLHRNFVVNVPRFVIQGLRALMQFPDETILLSQNSMPSKLIDSGFEFGFPTLDSCLNDLLPGS